MSVWLHDCESCEFLGTVNIDGRTFDLYTCAQGGLGRTFIARYGDDGPDYSSGLNFPSVPALNAAMALHPLGRELIGLNARLDALQAAMRATSAQWRATPRADRDRREALNVQVEQLGELAHELEREIENLRKV